ncbi:SCO7613 C-terminal domain-containing membrane protein [Glycomyces salinus]|uniref:SCO7613 C-terminal domain-containing membrane protein n=1 Tax=Glycomyces salinus TaxID=980294 RepID=UPI0018EDC356|nr:hypothetical protein [Glycomyces salinus]
MTNFSCPRCGARSTPAQCPNCGRGPEPLLERLDELDSALRVLSSRANSRAALEAERAEVLDDLGRLAASFRSQNEPSAPPATPPAAAPVDADAPDAPPVTMVPPPGTPPAPAAPPAAAPPTGPAPAPGYRPAPPPQAPVGGPSQFSRNSTQTLLLSLGGLLVAAAIIIFTAVAWRNLGDGGRLAVLAAFTAIMLVMPVALLRFGLKATAETFGALAALALWSSALAGYYQFRPEGEGLTPEAVGVWTLLSLIALAAYRGAVPVGATGWAMLPLAAIGSAYSAFGDTANAALLMLGTAAVLAGAAWLSTQSPTAYPGSNLWSARLLACGSVVLAVLAGIRVVSTLEQALATAIAGEAALLAAGGLLAAIAVRRSGAAVTTLLVTWGVVGGLVLAAWVLAYRAEEAALVIPSLALVGAVATVLATEPTGGDGSAGMQASSIAGIAALAAIPIVLADAPELSSHLAATIVVGLTAMAVSDPLGKALRRAAYIAGAAVGGTAAAMSLWTLAMVWWDAPTRPLDWEVPIVLAVTAAGSMLVPRAWRLDVVAFAAMFAVLAAGGLLRGDNEAVPALGLAIAAVIALASALASRTLVGRCLAWALLPVWFLGSATATAEVLDWNALDTGFALSVAAAVMLVIAAGVPGPSRADRILGEVLAHVLFGVVVGVMTVSDWFSQLLSSADQTRLLPASIGVYTLALAGAGLIAETRRLGYSIAALCTGTVGWWTLLQTYSVSTIEFYTVPPALLLLAAGLWRMSRRPETGSWAALSAPIGVGLGPSLLLALGELGEPVQRIGVGAAALALVVAGATLRWRAPLVLGSAVLLVLTVNEIALLWHLIPKWVPLAVGGGVLIFTGATIEQRRRDLRRLSAGLKSMR